MGSPVINGTDRQVGIKVNTITAPVGRRERNQRLGNLTYTGVASLLVRVSWGTRLVVEALVTNGDEMVGVDGFDVRRDVFCPRGYRRWSARATPCSSTWGQKPL